MSSFFVGEVRMFGGNFAPINWALCQGQLLPIGGNEALFSLIGTTYGGDGVTTFALPDLQGRVPLHQGQGQGLHARVMGEVAGTETVTLLTSQLPSHVHTLNATTADATTHIVGSTVLPAKPTATNAKLYTTQTTTPVPTVEVMSSKAVSNAGGSQPHVNMMPSLTINYIIALTGIFPSQ